MKAKVKTWLYQLDSGNIKSKTLKILHYIKNNPTTDLNNPTTDKLTMEWKLGIVHQSLTGCLSNLEDGGLIKVIGQIQKNHNHYSIFQFVYDTKEQEELIKEREFEKYNLWIKSGINNFNDYLPLNVLNELIKLQENQKPLSVNQINMFE